MPGLGRGRSYASFQHAFWRPVGASGRALSAARTPRRFLRRAISHQPAGRKQRHVNRNISPSRQRMALWCSPGWDPVSLNNRGVCTRRERPCGGLPSTRRRAAGRMPISVQCGTIPCAQWRPRSQRGDRRSFRSIAAGGPRGWSFSAGAAVCHHVQDNFPGKNVARRGAAPSRAERGGRGRTPRPLRPVRDMNWARLIRCNLPKGAERWPHR